MCALWAHSYEWKSRCKSITVNEVKRNCMREANKIGLDVAREALCEARNAKRVKMDDLWLCAQVRGANVMHPYG